MDAAELNGRAPIVSLTDDGLRFDALKGFQESGDKQLELARDYLVKAAAPDKALIFGVFGAVAGGEKKPNVGASIIGAAIGAVADVAEAIPSALLGVAYAVNGAAKKIVD